MTRDTGTTGTGIWGGSELRREFTGNGSDEVGVSFYFRMPNNTGSLTRAGIFAGQLMDATNGSEKGALLFHTSYADSDPGIIANRQTPGLLIVAQSITDAYVGIGEKDPRYKTHISQNNPGGKEILLNLQNTASSTGSSSSLRFGASTVPTGNFGTSEIINVRTDEGGSGYTDLILRRSQGSNSVDTVFKGSGDVLVDGVVYADQFVLNDINTPPSNSSDTGTKGEVRVTDSAIYVCIDTDTWVKSDLSTW
jgi:hypothetical protein